MTAKRSPTWQIRSREATYLDRQTCSPGTFLYMFWGPEDERKPNLLRVATLGPRVTFRGAKSELPSPRLQKSVRDTDDFCPCTQAPPSERAPAVSSLGETSSPGLRRGGETRPDLRVPRPFSGAAQRKRMLSDPRGPGHHARQLEIFRMTLAAHWGLVPRSARLVRLLCQKTASTKMLQK